MSLTLDHVQIAAPPGCEDAAAAFFTDLLGLPRIPKRGATAGTGGAWFLAGRLELHVGVTASFTPARKAHIGLRAPSAAALHQLATTLTAAGYPVRWDDRLPGQARFFTADPWGNRLELIAEQT